MFVYVRKIPEFSLNAGDVQYRYCSACVIDVKNSRTLQASTARRPSGKNVVIDGSVSVDREAISDSRAASGRISIVGSMREVITCNERLGRELDLVLQCALEARSSAYDKWLCSLLGFRLRSRQSIRVSQLGDDPIRTMLLPLHQSLLARNTGSRDSHYTWIKLTGAGQLQFQMSAMVFAKPFPVCGPTAFGGHCQVPIS